MEKVCIMMSTHNGEKYICQQLDSILDQKNVDVLLIVRDDGSSDNTISILKEYEKNHSNIIVKNGENVGYAKSFLQLVNEAPTDYEYYAFSDQDDIWLPQKMDEAIRYINDKKSTPCLYSCNLELVDENLKPIGVMDCPEKNDFSKGRYLIDKYSYGCTMVFNKQLRDLLITYMPSISISHDNWIGLLAVFCGEFLFDNRCFIKYRQHGNNVTGGKSGFKETWKRRIKNIGNLSKLSRQEIARELLSDFPKEFDAETLDLLYMVANYKDTLHGRLKFFFDNRTTRKSTEKNMIFRLLILLGKA